MARRAGVFARLGRIAVAGALVTAAIPLSATPVGAASIYYVDDDGDNAGAGTLSDPWRTIEFANSNSSAGDTIMVMPGRYEKDAEQDFPIYLTPGVRLVSTNGWRETVINSDGVQRVIEITDPIAGTEVCGFEISGGGLVSGAGIRIARGSGGPLSGWPVVAENYIHDGGGGAYGGGISVEGVSGSVCEPLIRDNEICCNDATAGGGIAVVDFANPTIVGNTISSSSSGGGIVVVGTSDATISDNVITGNVGRGIYSSLDELTTVEITGNHIVGNEGGLFLSASDYTVSGNWVAWNNSPSDGGGMAAVDGSTATCTNNFWVANTAVDNGGAVYASNGSAMHDGDTFYGNTAGGFAGAYVEDLPGFGGYGTFRNCILWDHTDTEDVANAALVEYSCTEDLDLAADGNTLGVGVIHEDPLFVDSANSDMRLQWTSPCVDTGHPTIFPGEDFYGTERPEDGDASGSAQADMGAYELPAPIVERFAGGDRYSTAVRIVREWFESADTAIIASGEDFPDALSAAGLAGAHDAPLLLTPKASVPKVVTKVLSDLGVEDVIIIGSEDSVSKAVFDTLDATYDVSRISGSDRYATSAKVAREVARIEDDGLGFNRWAFVARGDDFPDALALAPISYFASAEDEGSPILLTRPDELPQVTARALSDLDVRVAYVAGGTSAVSKDVKQAIDAILAANDPGGWQSGRWSGDDRFATSVAVAQGGMDTFLDDPQYVGIATGYDFPDALAGGVAAGAADEGVVLLTQPKSLPASVRGMLRANRYNFRWAEIYGGTDKVSEAVRTAVKNALEW